MNLKVLVGVSALLFPLLTIQTLAGIMPHPTMPENMNAQQATEFFTTWYAVQQAQTLFHILGIIWFGVFTLGLFLILRNAEPAPALWSRLVLWSGSAIVAVKVAVMAMVSGAISLVAAPNVEVDGMMILAIYHAGWYAHVLIVYFLPFYWTGVAFAVLKHGALPKWIGWFAVVGIAAALVGTVSVVSHDVGWLPYAIFMVLLVWTLATGVYCLATAKQPAPEPRAMPA